MRKNEEKDEYVIPNKNQIKKIDNLLSVFSENDSFHFKNYLFYIIEEEYTDTLNYSILSDEIISDFESKRNFILKTLIIFFKKKFNDFSDNMIFRIMNVIDRYIYGINHNLNEQKLMIIIQATFKLLSKFDNVLINFGNDEINNTEIQISKKLNFNFNFVTCYDILYFTWKIITNNGDKNETFYLSQMILIMSLYFIEMQKYDKISLVISSLFYSGNITKKPILKKKVYILYQFNEYKINYIQTKIEKMLELMVKNKQFDYIFQKFEDKKYMEIVKKYFI